MDNQMEPCRVFCCQKLEIEKYFHFYLYGNKESIIHKIIIGIKRSILLMKINFNIMSIIFNVIWKKILY